ncbi:hypothetical protein [Undibacterium sp.]|uniref:hypothetical protein n=1 Tax=Undibacterium sp. TaxID=1914977 RepID=UPI00272CD9F2|nr:hypothetical protein [Undibacterium sp.]
MAILYSVNFCGIDDFDGSSCLPVTHAICVVSLVNLDDQTDQTDQTDRIKVSMQRKDGLLTLLPLLSHKLNRIDYRMSFLCVVALST